MKIFIENEPQSRNFDYEVDAMNLEEPLVVPVSEGDWIYHCTKTEEQAEQICRNGFIIGKEADVTSSLDQAQGYGPICLRAPINCLDKLVIYPVNDDYSFELPDYPEDVQGLSEDCHDGSGRIYYIFDVRALNAVCKWERYFEGDR